MAKLALELQRCANLAELLQHAAYDDDHMYDQSLLEHIVQTAELESMNVGRVTDPEAVYFRLRRKMMSAM